MVDIAPIIKPSEFIADMPLEDLPLSAVNIVENMISDDGSFRQSAPFEAVFGPLLFQPRWLLPNQRLGAAYWIYASDAAVGVTDGVNHFDITPAIITSVADLTQPYTGGVVNGVPVVNSRQDGPWFWDQVTSNIMEPLPDWPVGDVCQSMRPFREFLIAMNVFVSGQRIADLVKWSDAAAPGDIPRSWTPDVDSQAGELSVSFNPGGLVDGRQLGDRFYMYKTNSTYVLQLIGGQFVFNNRPAFSTVGLLSRNSLIEWRGKHILLTDGDVVGHDGVNVQSLVSKKQRKAIFQDLDGANAGNSFLVLDTGTNQLAIFRPRVGEVYPTEIFTLNLEDLRFGKASVSPGGTPHAALGLVDVDTGGTLEANWNDRTTTWATDATRWDEGSFRRTQDFIIGADYANSQLFQLGSGSTFNGQVIEAALERRGLAFDDSERKKNVGRVWLKIEGAMDGQIQVEFGSHDIEDAQPVYGPARTFIIGTTRFLNFDATGYFIAYRISSVGQLNWRMVSMKVEVEMLGRF